MRKAATTIIATSATKAKSRGFTLIELLIVLLIMALGATLVGPRLVGGTEALNVRTTARDIAASLRLTRAIAIGQNTDAVFLVDVQEPSFTEPGAGGKTLIAETIALTLRTAKQERLDQNQGGIRFFPDGSSTGGRITLKGANREIAVGVDWLTGRVKVVD